MKTFISYHNSIDRLAGDIKKYLDDYAFNCFLAHEDIVPQSHWPEKIEQNLDESDLFLPLLTPEFEISFFCQQETGYAYCKGIQIVPVVISKPPMGFISDIQGIRFNVKRFDASCWKIVKHIAKNTPLSVPVIDSLISYFGETITYDQAYERAKLILNEFDFTPTQLDEIKSHIEENSQINETKKARDCIFEFMGRYKDFFDDDFVKWYDKKSRKWIRH